MKVLIIGSGGREHAIAWKILQSPKLKQLYITSQNASILSLQKNKIPVTAIPISENDAKAIVHFVKEKQIDCVIIGGETQLAAGLSDALTKENISVFGPSQKAAQIESSKIFSKEFMTRHHIPTARYAVFTEKETAFDYLKSIDYPIVIKASGLAAGKGVYLPNTLDESEKILHALFVEKILGEAGTQIIIEERLVGKEVSLLAFTDGITIKPMPFVRDHKRLKDQDEGPNTGGMGTYAPVPEYTAHDAELFTQKILQPTIDGLRAEKNPFVGVLYAGLMITEKGPQVLEFNCRFGDPETQVLMSLLETDLCDITKACIHQTLKSCDIQWKKESAVCVILAAQGYPQKAKSGDVITGIEKVSEPNVIVFQAGTRVQENKIITAGGRVLGVTAHAENFEKARKLAYQAVEKIHFDGMQYRHDIGVAHMQKKEKDLYAEAGVNISVGNRAVELMKKDVQATYGKEVLAGIGAFGGMFSAASFKQMQDPVLVASTDGIGTKVELAARVNRYDTLGFDMVNHSVNDILVQNARPLFFLDYIATSRLEAEKTAMLVSSMAKACREVNCALLGGETAEMPGVYMPNAFDIAGTIVGVVEKQNALPQKNLKEGDLLLGLISSGPHTNGYSLIRKIIENVDLNMKIPEANQSLIDLLLAPHRCYLSALQKVLDHPEKPVKALVHITGGGFVENIPRVLPEHLNAVVHRNHWKVPPLFRWLQEHGNVPVDQMYRVFNMGIGMIVIISPEHQALVKELISETLYSVGELISGNKVVELV